MSRAVLVSRLAKALRAGDVPFLVDARADMVRRYGPEYWERLLREASRVADQSPSPSPSAVYVAVY